MKKCINLLWMLVCLALVLAGCGMGADGRKEYELDEVSMRKEFATIFMEGRYECGFVIDEGEYVLLANQAKAHFAVAENAEGKDARISEDFSGNRVVALRSGEHIILENCYAVPSAEFYEKHFNDRSAEGMMLKAGEGYDVPAGEYVLSASGEGANYVLYADSTLGEILESGEIENAHSVQLGEGECIALAFCTIKGASK